MNGKKRGFQFHCIPCWKVCTAGYCYLVLRDFNKGRGLNARDLSLMATDQYVLLSGCVF
mgnify:CR=1